MAQSRIEQILEKLRQKLEQTVAEADFYGTVGLTVNIRNGEIANFRTTVEESEKVCQQ